MKQTITVKAVIEKDGKIIIRKNEEGSYSLPGGELGSSTDPKALLCRLVEEQTGCIVRAIQVLDTVVLESQSDNNEVQVCLLYAAMLSADELSPDCVYASRVMINLQQFEVEATTKTILEQRLPDESLEKHEQVDFDNDDIMTTEIKEFTIYTDGGSRGNPGPSAAAFVVVAPDGEIIYKEGNYLGITTNNQAEYQAVKFALEKAITMGVTVVNFRMDSLLVVNQMLGIYQIKNRDLWPIYANIKELSKKFRAVNFMHVRRELNKDADKLVNEVLDEKQQK